MTIKAQVHYKKLTSLIKQLIAKGFSDREIESLLDSLEELSGLYASLSSPIPKTIALFRKELNGD